MIVSFFGHHDTTISTELKQKTYNVIYDIFSRVTCKNQTLSFYCGGYGTFDYMTTITIENVRKVFKDIVCEKIFITPYIMPSAIEKLKLSAIKYDNIIYPPIENVPYRFAIIRRNEWMIKQSDIVIFFVKYSWGNAAKLLEFAKKLHKNIILIK